MSASPRADLAVDLAPSLLSIDVDRELAKLLERRFRSPQQYLVELVRAACARGARRVEVAVRRRRVLLVDDGAALGEARLRALEVLLERSRPTEERQAALAELEDDPGAGLLAALACAPRWLQLDSGDAGAGWSLALRRGAVQRRACAARGTRLHLGRRGDPDLERGLLAEVAAHAETEIVVDGALVSRRPLPGLTQAPLRVPGWPGPARVAIPDQGDLCHAQRLAHGLRVDAVVRPPQAGLVFALVVEAPADWPAGLWERGAELAQQLVGDLVARDATLEPVARARVDELMFLLHRQRPAHPLLAAWAPFALLGEARRWTLAQVRDGVAAGTLCALVEGDDPRRYDTRGPVLWLSPAQRAFLVEQLRLPLAAPLPAPAATERWRRLGRSVRRRLRALVEGGGAAAPREIARAALAPAERALVDAMQAALERGRWRPVDTGTVPHLVVVDARGRVPLRRLARHGAHPRLHLHRRHPAVARAALALARDPENLRLVLAALLDGEDAWCEVD